VLLLNTLLGENGIVRGEERFEWWLAGRRGRLADRMEQLDICTRSVTVRHDVRRECLAFIA